MRPSARGRLGARLAVVLQSMLLVSGVFAAAAPSALAAGAANFGLGLNGSTQYVTFGAAPGLGASQFTLELWFKRTGAGVGTSTGTGGIASAIPLITKGRAEAEGSNVDMNYFLGIDASSGKLVADFEEGTGGTGPLGLNHPVAGNTVVTSNVWHHAAVTYDGTWRVYLDGALDGTLVVNQPPRSDSIQHAAIGTAMTSAGAAGGFFQGSVDEARIWNVARTQTQIQAAKDSEIGAAQSGLIGHWGLNEGAGTVANNTFGTAAVNGTLTAGPGWTSGFVSTGTDFSLNLNGSSQYVTFGTATGLGAAQFTLELWFKRTGAGLGTSTGSGGITSAIPLVTKGRAEGESPANLNMDYFLGIDATTGVLVADFEDTAGGGNHPVTGVTVVTSNAWHHVAATFGGGNWNLYLDGNLDKTQNVGAFTPEATSIQHAAIGTAMTSTGVAAGFFQGSVDEARIWNVARTQTQIQAAKDTEIGAAQTGLIGHWGFNEGAGTVANNTFGTAAVNGTLVGTPTWTSGFVVPPSIALAAPADAATGLGTSVTLSAVPSASGAADVAFYGRPYRSGTFQLIATNVGVTSGATTTTSWSGLQEGQRYEWYATATASGSTGQSVTRVFDTAAGSDPTFVGAGDIAGCATNGDELTADVLLGVQGSVFTLGDNAYDNGLLTEFTNCYGPSWGQASIRSRTRPISGNHDFGNGSNNGGGYFDYFNGVGVNDGPAGPRNTGFYSYDIGSYWHVVALNTECGNAGVGCTTGSPQELWLRNDLAANTSRNVIVLMHRPFISSGVSGGNSALATLWADIYDYGVDLVLAGHDHHYERFDPLSRTGSAVDTAAGVREIIVGTGGFSETGSSSVKTGSLVRNYTTFGILRLALHQTSYDWSFLAEAGAAFTDSGTSLVNGGSNQAPVVDSVSISPSSPATNATLTANVTAHDPDGTTPTIAYQWTKNGVALSGATSSTLNLATPGLGDRGDAIAVRVTASDGLLTTAPSTASSVTVVNSAPTVGVSLNPSSPGTNAVLTATATPTDADGDSVGLTYVWKVDGSVVAGANSASFDLSVAGHGDRGESVTVEVTPNDSIADGTVATASATIVNSLPTASVTITPTTPSTTATITASVTASDADGDPIALTYVWKNGTSVVQTTGPTSASSDDLDLAVAGNGDAGDVITVSVTPNDGAGDGVAATDSVGVENEAPVVDSASISPSNPTTNATLTATASAHDPDGSTPTIGYQWIVNGTDVPGANASTFDLSVSGHGDRGDLIAVRVIASDGALASEPVTAAAVTVANSAPSATVTLAPEPAGADGVLTATATKSDPDVSDTVTLTYTWAVDGTVVKTTAASSSLTDSLDLAAAGNGDAGQTVQVTVTPSDGTVNGSNATDTAGVETKALTFNGTNQYVTFGAAPGLNASTFTLETWFRWTGAGAGTSTGNGGIASAIPLITKGRAEAETPANVNMDYFLGIDATSHVLVADFEDAATGANHPVAGLTTISTNTWHHAAVTYDGSTWRLYLDGVLDVREAEGAFTPEATSIQHAALATAMTSTGVAAGFFAGSLDEARIWNVARTGAQIRAAKDGPISGANPTGLIGRWALDEGSGTTANDAAGASDGTLVGGPTWISGYGFAQDATAPATPTGLSATPGDGSVTLAWTANGEPDLAGYDLYRSLTSPVATTGTPLNGADLIQTTGFTDTGLSNGTQYHYALVAVDGSGNRSSAVETAVTPAPNAAPTVSLGTPSDGATGLATTLTLTATGDDSDSSSLTVTFYGRPYRSGVFSAIGSDAIAAGEAGSVSWTSLGDGQRFEWYAVVSDGSKSTASPTRTFDTAPGADPVFVGAGDIAACDRTQDEASGEVLNGVAGTVWTAGDNVYINGTATEFANCYDPAWGLDKTRTRPTPGNHDWNTGNLNGYFGYFGTNAGDPSTGRSYYSYDVGPAWHILVLDSECARVPGGCSATSTQVQWARADLNTHLDDNLIVLWHKPRYSSGATNLAELQPFWDLAYQYGAELVLVGHDHIYERLAPAGPTGSADPNGVRQFTVGTGGADEHTFSTIRPTSEVRAPVATFGVLKLTLHASSYDWKFLPIAGQTFTDTGSAPVHASPNRTPVVDSVTITPSNPVTDSVLTANVTASDPDGNPTSLAYEWLKNGSPITGATSSTLDLAVAGNGDHGDAISVRVTASDGLATSSPATSAAVSVVNSTPTATVGLAPTGPTTNQTVTATATKADRDGDPVQLTFTWKNGSTVVKTTGPTSALTDTLDLSVAGNGNKGDAISVSVVPTDGTLTGSAATAAVTVANSAPAVTTVAITESSATTTSVLHASATASDADGDSVTITWQWTKNGVDIPGATGDALDLSVTGNGNKGDAIRVRAIASDGTASASATSSPLTVSNTAPTVSVALNTSTPQTNDTITATSSPADADGDAVSLTYVWTVNGVVKRNVTTSAVTDSFNLATAGNGDPGDLVAVQVTPNDGATNGASVSASATVAVDSTAPAAPSTPVVTTSTRSIALDWTDNSESDLAGYRVYRAAAAGGAFTLLTPSLLTTSTYADATPVVGSPVYRVVAVDTSGNASSGTDVTVTRSIAARSSSTITGTGSTLSVAKPTGTQPGDVLIVGIDNLGTGTPSAPGGWTQVVTTTATGIRQTAFVHVVGSSDPASYSFALGSSQGATAIAVAYVGVDPTTPFDDGLGQGNASSAQISAPSVTAADKAVLVTISGILTTASITPAGAMSEAAETSLGSGKSKATTEVADQLLGAAGATGTRTATATKAAANIGTSVALRPSGSAPPPPPAPTAPTAPLNVTATAGSAKVTLTWAHPASDGGSAITNYLVYRSTTSGSETLLTTVGNVTSFVDTGVTNGTQYFYKVAAKNSAGEGAPSGEVSATPVAATVPSVPLNVKAVPGKPRGIALSWSASTGATGYQIFRSTSSGSETFLVSVGTTTSYKDTGATSGVTYYYWIVATNAAGASQPSAEVFAIAR